MASRRIRRVSAIGQIACCKYLNTYELNPDEISFMTAMGLPPSSSALLILKTDKTVASVRDTECIAIDFPGQTLN